MGSNIINSNYKNYFLVDIYDMVLVDKKTKEIIISDTLTSCGIECTTSSTTVHNIGFVTFETTHIIGTF